MAMELMRERGIVDTMGLIVIAWDAVGDATNTNSFSPICVTLRRDKEDARQLA